MGALKTWLFYDVSLAVTAILLNVRTNDMHKTVVQIKT